MKRHACRPGARIVWNIFAVAVDPAQTADIIRRSLKSVCLLINASVVKLVDTRDSKSRALKSVPVRVRPLVPHPQPIPSGIVLKAPKTGDFCFYIVQIRLMLSIVSRCYLLLFLLLSGFRFELDSSTWQKRDLQTFW